MKKVKWNKKYIENKEELPKVKVIGVVHIHAGGYYSEDCSGCLYENAEMKRVKK